MTCRLDKHQMEQLPTLERTLSPLHLSAEVPNEQYRGPIASFVQHIRTVGASLPTNYSNRHKHNLSRSLLSCEVFKCAANLPDTL